MPFLTGINRNIVECKEKILFWLSSVRHCINRNIVECKVIAREKAEKDYWVLIETLWNVKSTTRWKDMILNIVLIETLWNVKSRIAHDKNELYFRINRNIVECKGKCLCTG